MPRIWEQNENMLIPYYLMFSYLYYEKNISLIDDAEFDQMCKTLLDKLDTLTHMHKHLVKKDVGYDIKYTNLIKDSAMRLKEIHGRIKSYI